MNYRRVSLSNQMVVTLFHMTVHLSRSTCTFKNDGVQTHARQAAENQHVTFEQLPQLFKIGSKNEVKLDPTRWRGVLIGMLSVKPFHFGPFCLSRS